MAPGWRWLVGLTLAWLPALVIVVTYQRWQARLPDSLPSHWGLQRVVDDITGQGTFVAVVGAIAVAGGLLASVALLLPRRQRRLLVGVGAAVGGFGSGLWLAIGSVSLDLADPWQAPMPTWQLPALMLGAVGIGLLAFAAAPAPPAHRSATGRPAPGLPRVDLPKGHRAAWSEVDYAGRPLLGVMLPLTVLTVVLAVFVDGWVASLVVITMVVAGFGLTPRLSVDRRGLHVGFGPWGWPRVLVPLSEIESAEVTEVRPRDWGGWGYRIRPRGRALVVRKGPGVRLTLSGQREFVASTRSPEPVAGLINTLVDQRDG